MSLIIRLLVWNHNTVYEWDTHVYENGREGGKIRKPKEGRVL